MDDNKQSQISTTSQLKKFAKKNPSSLSTTASIAMGLDDDASQELYERAYRLLEAENDLKQELDRLGVRYL